MKKTILLVVAFFTIASMAISQNNDSNNYSHNEGWGGKKVVGEGATVKESRDVKGFTGVKSGISADIYLKQASVFKVTIEGQKNILDLIKTDLSIGVLKISFEKGYSIRYKQALKVYIEAPSFESLGMSGSGNVVAENGLSGTKLNIDISGSGDFNLTDLKYANLNLGISGSGNVKVGGSADAVEMKISGSGDVKADNLKAQTAICNVSGSGNISCNVKEKLEAYVSGSGDIQYSGSPASVKTRVTGSGDIKAK